MTTKNKSLNVLTISILATLLFSMGLVSSLGTSIAQQTGEFKAAFLGDWTCSSNAQSNANNIRSAGSEVLQGLGDYAYTTNQNCWIAIAESTNANKITVTKGNHEGNENGQESSWTQLVDHFKINNPELETKGYYTYQYKNLFVIGLNTQMALNSGTQADFLTTALNQAKTLKQQGTVDYVVLAMHKMIFNCNITDSLGSSSGCADHSMSEVSGFKTIIEKIYGFADTVDLVLQGHDHYYTISKPLKLVSGQLQVTDINDENAIVWGVFGSGGRNIDQLPNVETKPLWWAFHDTIGSSILTFANDGETIKEKFITDDGAVLHDFVLKNVGNTPVCPDGSVWNPETNVCEPIPEPPNQAGKLVPTSIVASSQDSGKEADKVNDNDFSTRWSANGIGETIKFTFNATYPIDEVKLTGYHYDKSYTFEIDGQEFINEANRPADTLTSYNLTGHDLLGNEITIIGKGNSGSNYNSYREIHFYTLGNETDPVPPVCPDGQVWNPQTQICEPDPNPQPKPEIKLSHNVTTNIIDQIDNSTTYDFVINTNNITLYPKQNNTIINILANNSALEQPNGNSSSVLLVN